MRRLAFLVVGVLVAFFGGCCFLATALAIEAVTLPTETSLALFRVAALLATASPDGDMSHLVGAGLQAIWLALVVICLVPVGLVALLGEAVRLRSVVWLAGATGALTAAVPTLLRAAIDAPVAGARGPGETRATLILFLTGLAAGLVYWIVAGRSAAVGGTAR